MSEITRRRDETEGRRGSRIDTDEGGRYVGIPPERPVQCPGNRVRYTRMKRNA